MIYKKRLIKLLESALDVLTDATEEEFNGWVDDYRLSVRAGGRDSDGAQIEFGNEGTVIVEYEEEYAILEALVTGAPLLTTQELDTYDHPMIVVTDHGNLADGPDSSAYPPIGRW